LEAASSRRGGGGMDEGRGPLGRPGRIAVGANHRRSHVWTRGGDACVALGRGGATRMQEQDEGDASVPTLPLILPRPYGLGDPVPTDLPLSEGAANGKLKLIRVPWPALLSAAIVPP